MLTRYSDKDGSVQIYILYISYLHAVLQSHLGMSAQAVIKELSSISLELLYIITCSAAASDACSTDSPTSSLIIQPSAPCCAARCHQQPTKLIWMLFCCPVMLSLHFVLSCTFCSVSVLSPLSHLSSPNPCSGLSIPFTHDLS